MGNRKAVQPKGKRNGKGGRGGKGGVKRGRNERAGGNKRAKKETTEPQHQENQEKQQEEAWMIDDEEANEELLNEDQDYAEYMASSKALEELEKEEPKTFKQKKRKRDRRKKEDDEDKEEGEEGEEGKEGKGKGKEKKEKKKEGLLKPAAPLAAAASNYDRQKRVLYQREVIARLSQAVMESGTTADMFLPLDTLHTMTGDADPVVRNLAVLSEAAVWGDVLPDYQIRERTTEATTTATGARVQLSRAVIEKRTLESRTVESYRRFLALLEGVLQEQRARLGARGAARLGRAERAEAEEAELASVRAVCLLVRARPYFNFRSNLLELMVPHLLSPRHRVASECIRTVEAVFARDVSGTVVLELVRRIGRALKAAEFRAPAQVLEPYLTLAVDDDVVIHPFGTRRERQQGAAAGNALQQQQQQQQLQQQQRRKQQQQQHQSRKLVEFAKAERLLRKQYDESNAEYTRTELRRTRTAILDSVFTTYFRILRRAPTSPLLPVALAGVARHCRQINVDFMADIVRAIEDIMLRTPGLPPHIPFHCARTALLALKAQGYYTDVDLTDFFTAVYRALVGTVLYTSSACVAQHRAAVPAALAAGASAEISSHDVLPVALEALELLLVAPKQLPLDRVAAFVKRICAVPLLCLPAQAAAGFLCVAAKLLRKYPRLQNLLAGEQGVGAMGAYMPYLDMPDHANPWSTALWELPFLQTAPLYQPYLHRLVAQVLAGAAPEMLDAPSSSELATMLKRDPLWDGVLPPAELTAPSSSAALAALAPKNNRTPNKTLSSEFAREIQRTADAVEAQAQRETPFVSMFNSITKHKKQVADALKDQKKQRSVGGSVGAVSSSSS